MVRPRFLPALLPLMLTGCGAAPTAPAAEPIHVTAVAVQPPVELQIAAPAEDPSADSDEPDDDGEPQVAILGALSGAGLVPPATDNTCPSAQRFKPGTGCEPIPAPPGTHICSTALTTAAFQECQAQCAAGNPGSCTNIGFLYEKGVGSPKDDQRAASFYRKACDGGDPQGCKNYGWMLQHGQGVAQDDVEARRYYERGCREGNASSCVDFGFFAQNGMGGPKDVPASASYYRKACDGDFALGCANLGRAYANGWGVALDYDHAYRHLERACNLGELEACSDWGNLLVLGRGGRNDRVRGVELLRKGCAGGNQWGCDRLLEYGEVP